MKAKNLVFFSAYPHEDLFKQRIHHMLPFLLRKFQHITLITAVSYQKERVSKLFRNPKYFFSPQVVREENLTKITVYPVFPNRISLRLPILFKISSWIILVFIRRYLPEKFILGVCHPYLYLRAVKNLKCEYKFYDCPDLYESFSWSRSQLSISLEKKIVDNVDICFGSSKYICSVKSEQMKKDFIPIPNAVDFNLHQKNLSLGSVNDRVRKQVIYVGAIAEWMDFELLEKSVSKFNDTDFVVVGLVAPACKARFQGILTKHKNIRFLGTKKYDEIPFLLSQADVGIIPFLPSELIKGVSPLKLFEYAAHGLPIVSVYWEEISEYKNLFHICKGHESFLNALGKALGEGRSTEIQKFARQNSWEQRVEEMLSFL